MDMGLPVFENEKIPLSPRSCLQFQTISWCLDREIVVSTILMGVPHTIVFMQSEDEYDPKTLGPAN